MRSCWRKPGRRRWTTGASDPRPSCPSGSERGPARSPEIPSPLTMRTRDPLRLLRVLGRRRKRRNKCALASSREEEEELPNRLKTFAVNICAAPKNKYFVFILSWIFALFETGKKHFNFTFKRCFSSYQLSHHSDAGANR